MRRVDGKVEDQRHLVLAVGNDLSHEHAEAARLLHPGRET
jgi:hypothetical protein